MKAVSRTASESEMKSRGTRTRPAFLLTPATMSQKQQTLPSEVWYHIIRLAVLRPWPVERFFSPPYDHTILKSVAIAHPSLAAIVRSIRQESVTKSSYHLAKMKEEGRRSIRCVICYITDLKGFEFTNVVYAEP